MLNPPRRVSEANTYNISNFIYKMIKNSVLFVSRLKKFINMKFISLLKFYFTH